jgi:hypothetical protein
MAMIEIVNRLRSRGYSYKQVRDMLVKMGNSPEAADADITDYIREIVGPS